MNASVESAPGLSITRRRGRRVSEPTVLRLLLVAGCVASAGAAAWVGEPATHLQADPDLARLLRGMALIKASLVLAAIGALLWRFGRPMTRGSAAACLAGACLAAGASMLIWQLSDMVAAAVVFHIGEASLLVAAWREHRRER